MSYVAIARKWRPKNFEEISGQGHVTQTLENAILQQRVHHAYLFCGPRGVGKTTSARALSMALNCEHGPTTAPCGTCTSCSEIQLGSSPNVIEIDGASNNSVDDVRSLRENIQYLPANGKKKIYIIDEVHMLSKGAFNALLKTLEEPPPHVLFIFATTEPQKIPETILSRVQRFEFKRIPTETVINKLKEICDAEGIVIEDGGLLLIARAGEGSMRDSQSLLDQVISFGHHTHEQADGEEKSQPTVHISTQEVTSALGLIDRGLLYQMLEGLIYGDVDLCLKAVNSVYSYGYDLSEFNSELLELLRNATMVVLSKMSREYIDLPPEERSFLIKLAESKAPDLFVRAFQVVLDSHDRIARSDKPKLVMEMMVAKLVSIRPARPIDELLKHIRAMEHGASEHPPQPKPVRPSSPFSKNATENSEDKYLHSSISKSNRAHKSPTPSEPPVDDKHDPEPQPSPVQKRKKDDALKRNTQTSKPSLSSKEHSRQSAAVNSNKKEHLSAQVEDQSTQTQPPSSSESKPTETPIQHQKNKKQPNKKQPKKEQLKEQLSNRGGPLPDLPESIYPDAATETLAEDRISILKKAAAQFKKEIGSDLFFWGERVGILEISEGTLHLVAPKMFSLQRLKKSSEHPLVLSTFQTLIPTLKSISLSERDGIIPETLSEYTQRKQIEERILLERTIRKDPDLIELATAINGRIGSVVIIND